MYIVILDFKSKRKTDLNEIMNLNLIKDIRIILRKKKIKNSKLFEE